jgi:endonuclease YncB( thermonuclease family)
VNAVVLKWYTGGMRKLFKKYWFIPLIILVVVLGVLFDIEKTPDHLFEVVIEENQDLKENTEEGATTTEDVSIDDYSVFEYVPGEDKVTHTGESYEVVRVIDGDTVELRVDGELEKVRLIGMDSPEIDECFYTEAMKKAEEVLASEKVLLEIDETQDERDAYGRLLGYIILPDGTNFNELMVKAGYAREYTHITPYKYQETFKMAQKSAIENREGLWADGVCD